MMMVMRRDNVLVLNIKFKLFSPHWRLDLNDQKMKEMVPWYKGFKGIVEKYKKKNDLGDDEGFFVKSVRNQNCDILQIIEIPL
jgi:hypothetical protein